MSNTKKHSKFSGNNVRRLVLHEPEAFNLFLTLQTLTGILEATTRTDETEYKYKLGTLSVATTLFCPSEIFMYFSGSNTSSWKGLSVEPGLKVSWRNGLSWWCGLAANRQPDWECRYLSVHAKEEGKPWGAPWGSSVRRLHGRLQEGAFAIEIYNKFQCLELKRTANLLNKKNSKFIRLKYMYMETIVGTFSQSFWNSQIHGIKDIDVRDIEIQIVLGNCDFFCRLVH